SLNQRTCRSSAFSISESLAGEKSPHRADFFIPNPQQLIFRAAEGTWIDDFRLLIDDVAKGRRFPLPITNYQFFPPVGKLAQSFRNLAVPSSRVRAKIRLGSGYTAEDQA
ncbi:MAG: hypothetical protein WCJ66_19415, partial [Verrucomicrobiota bacterium]